MTHHIGRPFRLAAAMAISAVILTACSTSGEETSDSMSSDAPAQPVALTYALFSSNEDQLALFSEIADAYVAEFPDRVSSVEFISTPFEDYTTQLTTQIAGGNTPDIAWVLETSALEFVDGGALYDIAPALSSYEGYEYDDLLQSSLALWAEGDALYAYPFSNSPFGMFINTDLVTEAGQPNPRDLMASGDWTWDEAFKISAAVADTTGKAGFVPRDFNYQNWQFLTPMLGAYGAQPWSTDGSKCEFTSPEMVNAMSMLHDQIFVTGAIPGPGNEVDFFAGDAAMTTTQISRAGLLDDSFGWDLVPLPDGPNGRQNVIGQAGVGVLTGSKHPEAAADFLAYMTKPDNALKLAQFFPPPRESLLTAQVMGPVNPKLSEEQLQDVVIDGIPGAVTLPSHVRFAELQGVVRSQLDALWVDKADTKAVMADVCSAIEPLIN